MGPKTLFQLLRPEIYYTIIIIIRNPPKTLFKLLRPLYYSTWLKSRIGSSRSCSPPKKFYRKNTVLGDLGCLGLGVFGMEDGIWDGSWDLGFLGLGVLGWKMGFGFFRTWGLGLSFGFRLFRTWGLGLKLGCSSPGPVHELDLACLFRIEMLSHTTVACLSLRPAHRQNSCHP